MSRTDANDAESTVSRPCQIAVARRLLREAGKDQCAAVAGRIYGIRDLPHRAGRNVGDKSPAVILDYRHRRCVVDTSPPDILIDGGLARAVAVRGSVRRRTHSAQSVCSGPGARRFSRAPREPPRSSCDCPVRASNARGRPLPPGVSRCRGRGEARRVVEGSHTVEDGGEARSTTSDRCVRATGGPTTRRSRRDAATH